MMSEDVLARLRRADPCPQDPGYDEATLSARISAITSGSDQRTGIPLDGRAAIASRGYGRHRLAPVLAAAAVVAVVVGVLFAVHHPGTQPKPDTHRTPASAQYVVPPPPVGFSADEFRLASPFGVEALGGPPEPRPTCTPRQITAAAATRRTDGGVLGVVRLVGAVVGHRSGTAERCGLPIAGGPSALIGADGQPLRVLVSRGDTTSPPSNPRPDLALDNGDAIWGFAWLGSYCGPPASAIDIPLHHSAPGSLRIRLRGPQPNCEPTAPASRLIAGIAGAPGEPVQPPRPAYAGLRLTGRIEPGTTTRQLAPIDLTLRTTGSTPVTLDPCPNYAGGYFASYRSGGVGDHVKPGRLPCNTRAAVIRPGHSLHWTIPATNLVHAGTGAIPGSTVQVELGIAGVPRLKLKTTVHR